MTELKAIPGGANAEQPPWDEKSEREFREDVEKLLKSADQVLIIGFRRLPDGETQVDANNISRGRHDSVYEMMGHVWEWLHDEAHRR